MHGYEEGLKTNIILTTDKFNELSWVVSVVTFWKMPFHKSDRDSVLLVRRFLRGGKLTTTRKTLLLLAFECDGCIHLPCHGQTLPSHVVHNHSLPCLISYRQNLNRAQPCCLGCLGRVPTPVCSMPLLPSYPFFEEPSFSFSPFLHHDHPSLDTCRSQQWCSEW